MAKKLNDRCPLQAECERKCTYSGRELDCDYYANNGVGEDRTIPDQEDRRREAERRDYEKQYEADIADTVVDEVTDHNAEVGNMVMLPIDQLYPHPDNPRKNVGDVTELAESIKANGVLQNLTVVPNTVVGDITGDTWQRGYRVIIGHRRLAAAKRAGLETLPCVIVDMSEKEQLSTMLTENMQRADLTVYEQAQGFQMMLDLGDSVEDIAAKSGFSTKTVRRRVKMMELDQNTLKEVSERQLSLSDFDRLAKVECVKTRNKLLKEIGTFNFDGAVTRAIREEHRKKVIPDAKKQIAALGLKAVPDSERYSGKYEQFKAVNLDSWNPENGLGLNESENVFYYLDNFGSLNFYRKRKKAPAEKKSQEQIDREKAMAEAHAVLREETAIAFELRQKFVQTLSVTQKTMSPLLHGAEIGIVTSAILYRGADRSALLQLFGVDPNGAYNDVRRNGIKAVADYTATDRMPTVIYAMFQDSKNNGYGSTYKGDWPKHEENLSLDALYAWLVLMGYEMSDDEKALQDGTHKLFNPIADAEKSLCALCKAAHPGCDGCCENCNDHCNAWQSCRKGSEGSV